MEFDVLIQQPESRRDHAWEEEFLKAFAQMKVKVESDQAKNGPDGWPYLFVRTGPDATEPATQVVKWLAGRGIGLVVNAHKMLPDYIFPYGMLWNFVETGRFQQPGEMAKPRSTEATYAQDRGLVMGPPSEKYLPPYVRGVLREFLAAQGFSSPRVLVISSPDFREVDLVVSVDSLGQLPRSQHQTMAEMLAWFLPLHYTLVLGQEEGLPAFSSL
jgi:hypothetical protein